MPVIKEANQEAAIKFLFGIITVILFSCEFCLDYISDCIETIKLGIIF